MNILSHRGYWLNSDEKNTYASFKRSFQTGFGSEIDIRDYKSRLVVSHDIPTENSLSLETLLKLYKEFSHSPLTLAFNIKSDGIEGLLESLLRTFQISNCFVFDMSIPTAFRFYHQHNISFATRHSDIEKEPILYEEASWVWMDELEKRWIDNSMIEKHVRNGKKIGLVSPELHGRVHITAWNEYKNLPNDISEQVFICTDFPKEANEFFNLIKVSRD